MRDLFGTTKHRELCRLAGVYLRRKRCRLVLAPCPSHPDCREHPDAIGWQQQRSWVIEVKTSRSDFKRDGNKRFKKSSDGQMGNYRLYLTPKDLIRPDELPAGYGLLYEAGKSVREIVEAPYHGGFDREGRPIVINDRDGRLIGPDPDPVNYHDERSLLVAAAVLDYGEAKRMGRYETANAHTFTPDRAAAAV